jgi:hypothetical protein
MADDKISPNSFLRADEEEQGLVPHGGFGSPVRKKNKERDSLTMAEMKMYMASFWRDGDTYVEIAEKINDQFNLDEESALSYNNVHYHIKGLIKEAKKQSLLHITEKQALVLARYDQLEELCTDAYFRSMSSETKNLEKQIKQARTRDREKQLAADLKRERAKIALVNEKRAKNHKKLIVSEHEPQVLGDLPDAMQTMSKHIKKFTRTESKPAGDPKWVQMLIDINHKRAHLWHLLDKGDTVNQDQEFAKMSDDERASRMASVLHASMTRATQDKGMLASPSPLGGFQEEDKPEPTTQIILVEPNETSEVVPVWDFDD